MCILHNTIINRCQLDRKTAKTAHQSKDENRRHRIRNRKPRRPATDSRRPHTHHRHRTHERRTFYGTPSATAKSGNMQKPNPKALGRKLLQHPKRLRCRAHGTRQKRLPLRPNRSGTRAGGSGQGKRAHENRKTTQVPVCPEKTATIAHMLAECKLFGKVQKMGHMPKKLNFIRSSRT